MQVDVALKYVKMSQGLEKLKKQKFIEMDAQCGCIEACHDVIKAQKNLLQV